MFSEGITCAWDRVCMEMYSMHLMIQNSLEKLIFSYFSFLHHRHMLSHELAILQYFSKTEDIERRVKNLLICKYTRSGNWSVLIKKEHITNKVLWSKMALTSLCTTPRMSKSAD